jgi:hypothetical protein
MTLGVAEVQKLVRDELSTGARLGYTALAMSSLSVSAVVTSLLMTEPSLPLRTQAAFVVIAVGGLSWTAVAVWVLARRRVLLARHGVAASTLATTLALIFLVGAIALRERAGTLAVIFNAAMLAIAIVWTIRARRRMADLKSRAHALDTKDPR